MKAVPFRCNICGSRNRLPPETISREGGLCAGCASTVRMRSVIHCLTLALFGRSLRLPDLAPDRSIWGAGLSDWDGYAGRLAHLFAYANTFYHAAPALDITAPPPEFFGKLDFLIASDVFEHVAPPVERAFRGAFDLLKPGGALVLTVPSGKEGTTTEHFPQLNDFDLLQFGPDWYLVNRRADDEYEVFDRLVFHGGAGQTLEMRVFSEPDLVMQLRRAGFADIVIHGDDDPAVGVIHRVNWSLPITAVKPGGGIAARRPRYRGAWAALRNLRPRQPIRAVVAPGTAVAR